MKPDCQFNKMRFASLRKQCGTVNHFGRSGETRAAGGSVLILPVGGEFSDDFDPAPMNKNNLTRHEIFRGKISQRNQQSKPPQRKDAIRAKIMNNPNPFVPQGSVLEQNKRRSRMKLAVFCVLAVGVCRSHRDAHPGLQTRAEHGKHAASGHEQLMRRTLICRRRWYPPARHRLKCQPVSPPAVVAPPVVTPVVPETAGTEYVIVKGDTLGKIAKTHGVTLKALEDANPGVVPTN